MVTYEPTVAGNILKHERDIRKLGTAPLGPVSLGPGDHIRPEGSSAFRFDQSGAYLSHRGVLSNLSDLTDDFASAIDGHGGRLSAAEGRLDGHDATLSSHDGRITKAQNDVIGVHASVGALNTRVGTAESTLSSHDSRITKAQSDVVGVYNTVIEHDSRITAARSAAATAQSRADNAHTRIDGLNYASPNDLAALENRVASLETHIGVIDSWLRQHTGYPSGGLNPNP